MKLKTCLLGQSLICLGMIASHTEAAQATVSDLLKKSTLIHALENSDTSKSSPLTIQLSANPPSLIHTPIAPSEKIRAIASVQSARVSVASPEVIVERSTPSFRRRQPSEIATNHKDFLPVFEQAIAETFPPEFLEASPSSPDPATDPELGQLRLWDPASGDPELGRLRLWEEPSGDPELGRLRLQEQPLLEESIEETDEDSVFLLGRLSFFSSDNILLDAFDPVDDQVFEGGLGLFASPQIGPNTYLFGGIGRSLSVYSNLSGLNYSDLEINAGIRQVIFDDTYVDASWTNQQFFGLDSSGRFFTDNSLRLAVSHREQLTQQLFLDGYYQLRFSFTDPSDRSRIFNNFGISLGYDLEPGLEAGLGYQLILSDFTQEERHDSYHEVTAQLSYDISENARVTVFGGFSFGDSTEQSLNFNSSLFGLIFSTNFSLF